MSRKPIFIALTVVCTAFLITAGTTWAGVEFTIETTVDAGGLFRPAKTTVKTIAEGGNTKTDIPDMSTFDRSPPFFTFQFGLIGGLVDAWIAHNKPKSSLPKNGYILSRDGGKTTYVVDTDNKTFSVFPLDKVNGLVETTLPKGVQLPKIDIVNPKVEKLLEEPGPTILGYSTTHCKVHATYTMEMTMMGRKNSTSMVIDSEFWSTDEVAVPAMTADQVQPVKAIDENAAFLASMDRQIRGFLLKKVSVISMSGHPTMKSQLEVTDLTKLVPPKGTFEIPAGFKEQPFELIDVPTPDIGK